MSELVTQTASDHKRSLIHCSWHNVDLCFWGWGKKIKFNEPTTQNLQVRQNHLFLAVGQTRKATLCVKKATTWLQQTIPQQVISSSVPFLHPLHPLSLGYIPPVRLCVCVCVCEWVSACVRACVHACVRPCVCACMRKWINQKLSFRCRYLQFEESPHPLGMQMTEAETSFNKDNKQPEPVSL